MRSAGAARFGAGSAARRGRCSARPLQPALQRSFTRKRLAHVVFAKHHADQSRAPSGMLLSERDGLLDEVRRRRQRFASAIGIVGLECIRSVLAQALQDVPHSAPRQVQARGNRADIVTSLRSLLDDLANRYGNSAWHVCSLLKEGCPYQCHC
jgi:hypothetical protein